MIRSEISTSDLYIETQSLVRTFSVEFDQDEAEIAGEYRRRQFYATATEADVVRQIYINMNVTKVKRARRDEPELGALVYTTSASMLQEYIVRTPRRTFANPAGNFVIILMRPLVEDLSTIVVARIMEQLWRYYRMLNALLILSCDSQEVYICFLNPSTIHCFHTKRSMLATTIRSMSRPLMEAGEP